MQSVPPKREGTGTVSYHHGMVRTYGSVLCKMLYHTNTMLQYRIVRVAQLGTLRAGTSWYDSGTVLYGSILIAEKRTSTVLYNYPQCPQNKIIRRACGLLADCGRGIFTGGNRVLY